ncbi:MAG: Mrp/NBP35 family ATP-binding protein [Oscillospiraceae bacterium]|nr:Mrp/NBP35 family ATP-binding protein [Oscillospiraceae bacterium]
MSECNHDCSSCSKTCGERTASPFQIKPLHEGCRVGKVYGVVSGKGGVGKSMVTGQLAVSLQRKGCRVAVLDADITGPSIPKLFGVHGTAQAVENAILPMESRTGIQLMSVNLLLEHETDPVVWRGPVIGGVVHQFWTDVLWDDVDYMFVDMPPGTGDVALNVFQGLPVNGVIIVTSPQELVAMVVEKAVKMAQLMHVPVLGLVENMSYLTCPDCGRAIYPFGEGKTAEIAAGYGLPLLAQMPLDPALAKLADKGKIESFQGAWLDGAVETVLRSAQASEKGAAK